MRDENGKLKIVVRASGKCRACPLEKNCYTNGRFNIFHYIVGYCKRGTDGFAVVKQVGGTAVTDVPNSGLNKEELLLLQIHKIVIRNDQHPCLLVYKTSTVARGEENIKRLLGSIQFDDVLFQINIGAVKLRLKAGFNQLSIKHDSPFLSSNRVKVDPSPDSRLNQSFGFSSQTAIGNENSGGKKENV
jgi:hypothetical protein